MFKATKHFLKKLESLFDALGYTLRYEKGNFQSGYCLVEQRNVVVVNKFFDTDSRVQTLLEILKSIDAETSTLDDKNRKLLQAIRHNNAELIENEEEESSSN